MTSSTDRSKRMKKMFGNIDPDKLAKAPSPSPLAKGKPLVSSGAVKSMENAFSGIEQENERLREQLASDERIVSLVTDLIEPSFVQDRMNLLDQDAELDPDFVELKDSIEENGQQLPILVRPSPNRKDGYQIAYGRRRLKACEHLGIEVKAIIRPLSDEELVVAQGRENSERKDLSFIETAMFALRLKERGFTREIIASSLGKGSSKSARTYISKLTTIAQAIPHDVIKAIGPASKIGREKWDKVSGFFGGKELSAEKNTTVTALIKSEAWKGLESNARFQKLLDTLEAKEGPQQEKRVFKSADGLDYVSMLKTPTATKFSINHGKAPALSDWLIERMPDLIKEFEDAEQQEANMA